MRCRSGMILGMFVALILSGASVRSLEAASAAPTLSARATGVGLYARQDVKSDRIATLEEGESLFPMVEAVGAENWYMVRTQRGQVGWVRASDVNAGTETREAFRERETTSTWTARSADGRTFTGTWSVAPGADGRSAEGGWTLNDGKGTTVFRGTWSADKHSTGWNGVWRATVEGAEREYKGSWSAELPHMRNPPFAELFAAAAKEAIRGLWTGGAASGSWSIRYVK